MAIIPKNYARLESGYREKALKIYPWVCGRCSREFVYSNLRELTVHHIDHDHTNNPEDGSNWELLCSIATIMSIRNIPKRIYGTTVIAGEDAQKMSVKRSTTHSQPESDDEQEEVIKT
ncbi:YajD family HNH nuclease [Shigella flexneri]